MEPKVCQVAEHGPMAHKHPRSLRWFYKPGPQRPRPTWLT